MRAPGARLQESIYVLGRPTERFRTHTAQSPYLSSGMNPRSSFLTLGTASDGLDDFGASKRRRLSNGRLSTGDDFRSSVDEEDHFGIEDPLANLELYALAETMTENPSKNFSNLPWNCPSHIGLNFSAPKGKRLLYSRDRPRKYQNNVCASTIYGNIPLG